MFPGMKGMDPRAMQRMMKQMGIKNEEMEAERVIIEGKSKKIIIENPSVNIVVMQGKKTYTIMGDEKEEEKGILSSFPKPLNFCISGRPCSSSRFLATFSYVS